MSSFDLFWPVLTDFSFKTTLVLAKTVNFLTIFAIFLSIFMVFWAKHLQKKSRFLEKKYKTLLSQKKSSEVRLGQISEQLAPFLQNFPYDPKKISFLGNPIDYVYFGNDKVVIIEIKSGKSKLSAKQRKIKKLIQQGKVEWHEIRIE